MTTKPKTAGSSAEPRQRNRALVILDIVVGVLFALIGISYMFLLLQVRFVHPHEAFGVALKIFSVASWVAGVGVFITFATRRRVAFYWPIVGIAVMLVIANLLALIAGASA